MWLQKAPYLIADVVALLFIAPVSYTHLIAEQYTDIAEKLDKANDRAAQIDDVRDRLRTLETVVMNHTAAIKELRKAE